MQEIRRFCTATVLLLTVSAVAFTPMARAARVLVLWDGRVVVRDNPFLRATPTPPPASASLVARAARRNPQARIAGRTVSSELLRLQRRHAITSSDYRRYLGSLSAALGTLSRLRGTRAAELQAVIQNLHNIAAARLLTPSRLPALFLTLDRNRQWWSTGSLLSYGQRVQFAGSQLVWEYYPRQGIELQELGSFGGVDWMYQAGPKYWPQIRALLSELIPLAAQRGGGIAWEYYFNFGGGVPPWTSAMSQGTAIQALTQASQAFHDKSYLDLARRALPIFDRGSPTGVSVSTSLGRRYLLYSFAPGSGEAVINGFLQSLIGLFDYAKVSGDPRGWRLFRAGDAEARAELPSYDTGAWSLYQPGEEASLDYHTLVTEFLQQLCTRTQARAYCSTAVRFQAYLKAPPSLQLVTGSLNRRSSGAVRFRVSKISRVGITILRGDRTVYLTSADFSHGLHRFWVPALRTSGSYTIRLDAKDLAGNYGQINGSLQVSG